MHLTFQQFSTVLSSQQYAQIYAYFTHVNIILNSLKKKETLAQMMSLSRPWLWEHCFSLRVDYFQRGFGVQESQQEVTKVDFLVQMAETTI